MKNDIPRPLTFIIAYYESTQLEMSTVEVISRTTIDVIKDGISPATLYMIAADIIRQFYVYRDEDDDMVTGSIDLEILIPRHVLMDDYLQTILVQYVIFPAVKEHIEMLDLILPREWDALSIAVMEDGQQYLCLIKDTSEERLYTSEMEYRTVVV